MGIRTIQDVVDEKYNVLRKCDLQTAMDSNQCTAAAMLNDASGKLDNVDVCMCEGGVVKVFV
jgi:hypothetical protein